MTKKKPDRKKEKGDAQAHVQAHKDALEEMTRDLERTKEMLGHSLKQISLMVEERDRTNNEVARLNQINEANQGTLVSILSGMIESRQVHRRGHSGKVAEMSAFIAQAHGLSKEDVHDIQIAALLHELGRLSLPDALAQKDFTECTRTEKDLLARHPVIGAGMLEKFIGLTAAALIIRHIHEHVNGSGVPFGLRQGDIPIGSRVVAAANVFDHLMNRNEEADVRKSIETIEEMAGERLDGQIVCHLHQFVETHPKKDEDSIKAMNLFELQPGMELAAGIFTLGGAKLLPVNTVLTEEAISQVAHYAKGEPVMETVYIK